MAQDSPMMQQFYEVKKQYPDCILFFRLGDFYEMFGEDAQKGSKVLGIALTSRSSGEGRTIKIPMCGIPYHAADAYLAKLVKQGYRVVLCDQVEDPKQAKGIVKREVVRVVTPGTAVETSLLTEKTNNYLVALNDSKDVIGLALVDASTGYFALTEFMGENKFQDLANELSLLSPRECLLAAKQAEQDDPLSKLLKQELPQASIHGLDDWIFEPEESFQRLTRYFETPTLEGFGIQKNHVGLPAAAAILHYLTDTYKTALKHVREIKVYSRGNFMVVDRTTQENLDLVESKSGMSLLSVVDRTHTSMGGRMLRSWVLHPLTILTAIRQRHEAVGALMDSPNNLEELHGILGQIHDLERIIGRVGAQTAHARDLLSLKQSLKQIPLLKKALAFFTPKRLQELGKELLALDKLTNLLEISIREDALLSIKEGHLIKPCYSKELDELLEISRGGKEWIAKLQQQEKERTGIGSLKVQFNQVFGYYIEISKANLEKVPADYQRKQTLVNAERFITPALKEYETTVLGAQEKIVGVELKLFLEIREKVGEQTAAIQQTARAVAEVDSLCSFADLARDRSYVAPQMHEGDRLSIEEGRHPVLESLVQDGFVPNDTELNQDIQILLITGPNMAGKSTYLRQVALISLMAQMGSFVPAKTALLPVLDRVFTRVGASDQIARGQSTFMVEMVETSNILHSATDKSLVILDEIGRGTSTFDGISIAWAVAEFLHDQVKAKTLFATHYYELTELPQIMPRVKNMNIAVKEWKDKLIFLRKIVEGSCDRSYGIQVGRLAGLPKPVLDRAKQVLHGLENAHYKDGGFKGQEAPQLSFFESRTTGPVAASAVEEEIKAVDLNQTTPLQALQKLKEWQEILRKTE